MSKPLSELFDEVYSAANEIELGAHPLAGSRRSSDAWTAFTDAMNAIGDHINPNKESFPLRFDLIWRDGGYHVSLPQIPSMEVVDANAYDELERKLKQAKIQRDYAINVMLTLENAHTFQDGPQLEVLKTMTRAYSDAMDGEHLPDGDGYDWVIVARMLEAAIKKAKEIVNE